MISSSGLHGADVDHGIQLPIRCFSGAVGERIVGGPGAYVEEHSHDWPVLSLYVMGSCRKIFDGEEITIDGPSAVLHGSKQVHANHLGKVGLEQIDVQFDPRWLGKSMPDHALSGIRTWVARAGLDCSWPARAPVV